MADTPTLKANNCGDVRDATVGGDRESIFEEIWVAVSTASNMMAGVWDHRQ